MYVLIGDPGLRRRRLQRRGRWTEFCQALGQGEAVAASARAATTTTTTTTTTATATTTTTAAVATIGWCRCHCRASCRFRAFRSVVIFLCVCIVQNVVNRL